MNLQKDDRDIARTKKRVCNFTSRKSCFVFVIGASVLTIVTLTYTDLFSIAAAVTKDAVSSLTEYGNFEHRTFTWTYNNNNATDQEQYEDNDTVLSPINTTSSVLLPNQQHPNVPEDGQLSAVLVTNGTRVLQNRSSAQANNSRHTFTEVQSVTTTMTFNTTLVVHCMKSPYIECTQPKVTATDQKVFKIAVLRNPSWLPIASFAMKKCLFNQCTIQETTVTMETDLVFVYGVGLPDSFKPPNRWPHQLFVIGLWESPVNTRSSFLTDANSVWNHQFNLTMTYRVDADIFSPYAKLRFNPQPLDKRPNYDEIAKKKTKTAVWIVSHCRTPSKRETYVKQMQKYVDVDILGSCGQPCSETNSCDELSDKYKFYLSFENSLCTDYVTEKFFKIFLPGMHMIPVVMGGANYDKYFPKFSYINKYVDVDILGGCGQPCSKTNLCDKLSDKYKFYLSFENSLCTDYVTEKLFKLFRSGIHVIPVVKGGADYDKYFPKYTYINAAHFKSAKDLALYLKDLASDLDKYSKYLEYKDLYVDAMRYDSLGCRMCEFLNTKKLLETKTYNLKSWLSDGHCRGPTDI